MADNFIKVDNPVSSNRQMEIPLCPNHIGERQYFFCVTCGVSICHNCRLLQHSRQEHKIREWKEVMEEEEQKRNKKQELGYVERKLKSAKTKAEQDVKIHGEHLIAEVKNWVTKMNQDIELTYQWRITTLQEKQIELDRPAQSKWNRSVTSRMEELSIQHEDALIFQPGRLNWSNFGELVSSAGSHCEKQATSEIQKFKLTFITEISNSSDVYSIAAHQSDLIAVASNDPHIISIYGKYNGEYVKQSEIAFDDRVSVAISFQSRIFAVCDDGLLKIFSSAGAYERSWPDKRSWNEILALNEARKINVIKDAAAIAITPDDKVVIGSRALKTITVHRTHRFSEFSFYSHDAIRSYQVECDRIASNGKQIAFTARGLDSVCVIHFVKGHTLWAVNFSRPLGICYEPKSNTLLVLGKIGSKQGRQRQSQGVIKQYCSKTGRIVSCLTIDVDRPNGMTVTHDNKLVLADGNKIKVYNIDSS